MDCTWSSLCWWSLFSAVILLLFIQRKFRSVTAKPRPPGPSGWELIQSIMDMSSLPHQYFYKLIPKYGPLLWINLGPKKIMVVQSAKAAAEMFKNHDMVFCDRLSFDALNAHDYRSGSMVFGSYGPYWRVLRRLTTTELLGNKRVNETLFLRRKCIDDLIRWIDEDASDLNKEKGESGKVDVAKYLFLMAFNIIGNLTMSRDVVDPKSKEGQEFFESMNNIMEWIGMTNVADVWPVLRWLDPQGIRRGMDRDMGRAMEIVARLMKERVDEIKRQPKGDGGKKDFLTAILACEGDVKEGIGKITDKNTIVLIVVIFLFNLQVQVLSK